MGIVDKLGISESSWKIYVAGCLNQYLLDADNFAMAEIIDTEFIDDRLLASAPEMLEALIDLLGYFDEPCRLDHHGYCQEHFLEEECSIPEYKKIVEKATNKSWEEIKELMK